MSRLNEDTYTSSEEDEYVFDEPEAPEKSTPIESVKKQSKTTEVIEETLNFDEELSENGTELESGTGVEIQIGMEADDSGSGSESEYEEVVIRKRVKKKKTNLPVKGKRFFCLWKSTSRCLKKKVLLIQSLFPAWRINIMEN